MQLIALGAVQYDLHKQNIAMIMWALHDDEVVVVMVIR